MYAGTTIQGAVHCTCPCTTVPHVHLRQRYGGDEEGKEAKEGKENGPRTRADGRFRLPIRGFAALICDFKSPIRSFKSAILNNGRLIFR